MEARVKFLVADLCASDFSDATVATLFLRPLLWQQLKPGSGVVPHVRDMGAE